MKARRRLALLGGTGVLIIAGTLAYIEFHFHFPEGSGPAGPPVALAPFQNPWTDKPVLLLGLGDSVTAGLGSTRGHSYFELLASNPDDEFEDMRGRSLSLVLPSLRTENLAVSGSNSLQHLQRAQEKLDPQPKVTFGLVVLTSGGNDLIHWYGRTPPREGAMYGASADAAAPWIANYGQRMDDLFTLIEARFPGGCRIFVGDIYDPSDGQGDPESALLPAWSDVLTIHSAYNQALRSAAQRHPNVRVVPVYETFLGHGIHCRQFWRSHFSVKDPHYWYAPNLEDPNNRGYDALRRVFLNAIVAEHESLQRR